jgi:HSP20 family protein
MYNNRYGCGRWGRSGYSSNQAPVNISETENGFIIDVHAPGLEKEHISLATQNDILYIRYKGNDQPKKDFTRREYRVEEIDRSFDLKGKVNTAAITANYSEGILTIRLPKNEAAKRPAQEVKIN